MNVASAAEFRDLAKRRLPPFLFHYIDGAAYDELTSERNVSDFAGVRLRQRVLRDTSRLSLDVSLFGQSYRLPIGLGPVGLSGMYARRGEIQAANAAKMHHIPFCLSTVSICSLSEVAGSAGDSLWFQLYVLRDRGFMRELLTEARNCGSAVLLFTVDMPMPGARYRDRHSGMSGRYAGIRRYLQALAHPRWAWDVGIRGRPHSLGNLAPVLGRNSGLEDFIGWIARNFDPGVTWQDLDWIREYWEGPLVIKGILEADDARQAVSLGADGIVVSNHGGRQLDGVPSTVRALPAIANAVGDRVTIMADGGVRSGLDVVRMLALGADAVLLGRAWAFALGAAGGAGVARLLDIFESEMRIAMALTGNTDIANLGQDTVSTADIGSIVLE